MATFLYRIGRFAFGHRRLVLLLWAVVLGAVGAVALNSPSANNTAVTLPGTEAQHASDLLSEKFPAAHAGGASARVVMRAPKGEKIVGAENRAGVAATLKALKGSSPHIASVTDPFATHTVSRDGATAYAQVTYTTKSGDLGDGDRDKLRDALDTGRHSGLTVEASGDALTSVPQPSGGEAVGFLVAAVILVVTFGSLVAAGLPLLTALVGVGISVGALTALGSALDLNSNTSTLAMMLGLAVGIDYALFIVSRYRAERAAGHLAPQAAARANGTAGTAVVFAGLTVLIALVGLSVVDLPILTAMGLGAAGAVAVAVLVAVTLVPALLGLAPERVLGRAGRRLAAKGAGAGAEAGAAAEAEEAQETDAGADAEAGTGAPSGSGAGAAGRTPLGRRWAALVLRRPLTVLVLAVVALGVVALPAAKLELGLPDDGSQPTSTTQRKAYDMLADSFGAGFNGPLTVTVDDEKPSAARGAATRLVKTINGMPDVANVAPPRFNPAGDTAIVTVVPRSSPSSDATKDLVHDIRDLAGKTEKATGARGMVTGTTALNIDVSDKFSDAIAPYLALVVGLAFLVLILVFRSILVPLKAALGFLLSVLAALGGLVAVFQWGWLGSLFGVQQTGPIMSLMPILMVGIVFGLAMDYQVFLVTRIREEYVHGADARGAIQTGFGHSAKVVTAAALIMITVFSGFVGSTEAMIKSIGFGLAIAVAFDAFVVRMTIVPAVLALLGRGAWWLPRWLDRLVPNVDIEGEKLERPAAGRESDERDNDDALASSGARG